MYLKLLMSFVDAIFSLLPQVTPSAEKLQQVKIVAHRGWHNAEVKENSLESFKRSHEHGLWGIEFDIRWTKDLVPVVHHDVDCKRVWGKQLVISQVSFQELRTQVPGIPSLQEVVDLFSKKLHFFIELKLETFTNALKQKENLINTLRPLQECEDFHLISIFKDQFDVFDIFSKETKLMIIRASIDPASQIALERNYGGILGHYLITNNETIDKHHLRDQKVGIGFCKNKKSMYREIQRGADWIFTNHPWNLVGSLA
jgi:glycerophosphoryl diester phosphodiesterase